MDAPERAQQGWDRDGAAVPVGQQATDALTNMLAGQTLTQGPAQGSSYGRTVAPFDVGGADLAQQFVRDGNALAAPDYVKNDPAYRFDLLQAERLARLNGLGVHDYLMQNPAEHRRNPDYQPDRRTVAQFFDTPTPIAGMRPEAEVRYVELLNTSIDPQEIAAFVESQGGFKIDLGQAAKWIEERDAARAAGGGAEGYATYTQGPEVLTDTGTGASGAAIRGFGQGFVAGGLDELGAVPDMLGLTPGRESIWNSDRRYADIWSNNQQQNASILGYDESAHPIASTTGELTGAVTSGFAVPWGAGARAVPQLAKVGAAYGGAEGFLGSDGGWAERAKGAAIGAPIGAGINAVGGKALEYGAPIIARAYRAMSERGSPKAAEVAGEAATGFSEDQAVDAAQNALRGQRAADGLDMQQSAPGAAYAPEELPTGMADVPPPPPGFKIEEANDNGRTAAMDAEGMPSVYEPLRQRDYIDLAPPGRPQPIDQSLSEAQMRAITANVQPSDVLPLPSNFVGSPEEAAAIDAGRFATAKTPNERAALTPQTIRNWQGQEVAKRGPIDMVGWLRTQGGLLDQGGELAASGIVNNAARRGLDFVGPETRFGPIVNNDSGMTLDDAAHAAWEVGYFPEMTERPTVSQFLDAVRETYDGGPGRRFQPEAATELDTFYGRQAERYDLEQQQQAAGGPVYVLRSQAVDEPPPFPPVQAYEEWPTEAIERAGNIDLSKLQTPQDINRALYQVHSRVGFDAATRGRVTHAETERLASDLGMTADDLLKRRKGQALNAEEALAARQLLAKSGNELVNLARKIQRVVNPGDVEAAEFQRALVRHAAIQEQVSGMTAEAGRTLSQFRMMADSRAVPGEVLAGIVEAGGGPKRVKNAAEIILGAIEGPPGHFNAKVRKAASPRFSDKLAELYINNLLSGPQTHVVNAIGNTMTALSQIPETVVAAGLGGVRRLAASKEVDRVMGGEIGARMFGLLQGTKEGARLFAQAVKTGETSDTFSKIAGHDMRAISGVKGEVIRVPGRMLNAADELFKGMSRRAEINALAYRQAHREGLTGDALKARIADLSANPTDAIELRALDFARYMTFQNPLTGIGGSVSRMVREYPLMRPVITFVRTPANLLKFSAERSPLAPLLKEWRDDMKAGGARRDLAIARSTLGTGFATMFYEMALNGQITGSAPTDPAKNRYQRADGWQPYSVRIGDEWVSYSRLDPFALQLGVAADLALKSQGMSEKQLENYSMMLVGSIMKQLADKTWLSGVSDFTEATSDVERYGGAYLRRLGASLMVPNALAQAARTIDPVQRERETFSDELKARIPGLSDDLLPQRDIWGRPVVNEGGIGPDLLSPFRFSTIKNDPVNAAMLAVGAREGLPSKQYTEAGRRVDYTPEQYNRLQELAGPAAYSGVLALISDPRWQDLSVQARRKAITKAFDTARDTAKGMVLAEGRGLQVQAPPELDIDKVYGSKAVTDANIPAPPPGFQVESEEGEAAGLNVYADLQEAIPGVRVTSGFRTPEYQEDMRRRGYKPAQNSAHLDGSALDLLPPQGRSLQWLRREVGELHPDAALSIHDGHLHAEFPGYYGAPPLEGAKAAGIRNPLAGIPAPPAGFVLE
jgi:hypothetical protein